MFWMRDPVQSNSTTSNMSRVPEADSDTMVRTLEPMFLESNTAQLVIEE
jgi:hypothetical protein